MQMCRAYWWARFTLSTRKKHTGYSFSIVTIRRNLLRGENTLMYFFFFNSWHLQIRHFPKFCGFPQSLLNKGIEKLKLFKEEISLRYEWRSLCFSLESSTHQYLDDNIKTPWLLHLYYTIKWLNKDCYSFSQKKTC